MIRTQRLGRAGGAGALLSHHNRMPNMTSKVGRQHSSSFLPPLLQSPTSVSPWLNPARNQQTKESRKRRKWLFCLLLHTPHGDNHTGATQHSPRAPLLPASPCMLQPPASHTHRVALKKPDFFFPSGWISSYFLTLDPSDGEI